MSLLGFLFKSKKEMAKPNTRVVKLSEFKLTSHAQNRIVDPKRNLKKMDIVDNLYRKPLVIEDVKFDDFGRPSYTRIGSFATTKINPINNNLTSAWRTNKRDAKKYNLTKKGRKYVK